MHTHHYPKCHEAFDCTAPFCQGIASMDCDGCWEAGAKLVPLPEGGYKQVVDYAREREEKTAA